MIVSKPKPSTLFSLGLFILLVGALTVATFISMDNTESIYWYHYLFLVILIPLGGGVLLKVLISYKITSVGKGKMLVSHPILFRTRTFEVNDIKHWEEIVIKTATGTYQQLEVLFNNGKKLTLGRQEHSCYDEVVRYLRQKAGKKRLS